jgi:hypothetical protein
MTFDLNNLSLKSLEKYHLVLDDIKFNMEIQNKTKYLDMGEFEGIEGVPKNEHQNIMNTLLNDTDLVDDVHRGGNRFGLDINVVKFDKFSARVSERIAKLKGSKSEFVETTTKNTKWADITIRFLNDQEVKIENEKETSETNYEEMGFADGKSKQPILCWGFLHLLSTGEGVFPLGKLSKKDNNARITQKKKLSDKLKTFFKIKEDPFEEYDRWKKEYRIKLKLVPIPTFREDFRDRHITEGGIKNDKIEGIGEQFADDTNRK